jgi:hypothetical protein
MKLSAKKFLGLVLGLTALSLGAQNAATFGNLPLWFEAGTPAKFTAHASDAEFSVSPAGAAFTLTKKTGETAGCQLQFVGANPAARITGDQKLSGTVNYLLGSDAGQWRANVPTFAQVRVEDVYPGVSVVYYGNRQKLEYDFNLAAGVNPSAIALRFAGAEKISVDPQGGLVISLGSGEVVQHPPVAYQTVHGARQEIAASYKMLDAHTAAFALGDYDRSQPLVIDPVLTYSSYFGGNSGDIAWAIALNPIDGSIYLAGQTFSTKNTNSPSQTFSTPGAYQTNYNGGKVTGDAFVARFDNSGSNLIYATYLGGSGNDGALSLAVDSAGNAYLAGFTDSTNFPTTNALASHISGVPNKYLKTYPEDAFVAELNPAGNGLVYATYLGGESMDAAFGIALDDAGDAFVTGYTYSTNFPVTPNGMYQSLQCSNTFYINANAFVAEISPGGTNLNYSTYLGGTNFDQGRAIAYNNGMLFVAGYTLSTNFPVTNYIPELTLIQTNYYTNKIHGVDYLTNSIATNTFVGNLLNGVSTNLDKYTKKNPLASDAFVTAFTVNSPTSLSLLYSTFLGGTNDDQANAIAADAAGNAYVAGNTSSTNFPDTVPGTAFSYVNTNMFGRYGIGAATNGFLTKIVWDGTNAGIAYSAMFGGKGADVANGVALDSAGNAYVIGSATSTNFPVTTNNIGGDLSTTNHYYKKRFKSDVIVIAFNSDASSNLFSAYLGGTDNDYGNAIAVDPLGGSAYIAGSTFSTNFPTVNALQSDRNGKSNDMFVAVISLTNAPPVPALLIAPQIPGASVQNKIAGSSPEKSGITLKWQMFPANYDVESSTDLAGWQPAPATPTYSNGWFHVTLPTTNSVGFFRLHKR